MGAAGHSAARQNPIKRPRDTASCRPHFITAPYMVVVNVRERGTTRTLSIVVPRTLAELVKKIQTQFGVEDHLDVFIFGSVTPLHPSFAIQTLPAKELLEFVPGGAAPPVAPIIPWPDIVAPPPAWSAISTAAVPAAALAATAASASSADDAAEVDDPDVPDEDVHAVLSQFNSSTEESALASRTVHERTWRSVSLHFLCRQPWLVAVGPRRQELSALADTIRVRVPINTCSAGFF